MDKIRQQEGKKCRQLIQSAQAQLEEAKKSEAPKSDIEFIEQRIEALEGKLKKIEGTSNEEEEREKSADAVSSKTDGRKKKKFER
jgi:hypothetical protein